MSVGHNQGAYSYQRAEPLASTNESPAVIRNRRTHEQSELPTPPSNHIDHPYQL
jgi:hypothetical protein